MPSRRYAGDHQNLLHCPHAVFVLEVTPDARFRVVAFNEEEERLVGISNANAAGRYVDELLGAEVARPLVCNYTRGLEAGEPITYDEQLSWAGDSFLRQGRSPSLRGASAYGRGRSRSG